MTIMVQPGPSGPLTTTYADDLTKRIAAATALAKNALGVQNDLEKELFAADAEVAGLKDGNLKLDAEIKHKELGR